MARSSPTIPSAARSRRWRTQPGASFRLFMAAAPAREEVDAAVEGEGRDEEDEGDRGRPVEAEILELVEDEERGDLGVPGARDEDDGAVLADRAGEGESHAREEGGQDAG